MHQRGRDLYKKYEFILKVIIYILKPIPRKALEYFWVLTNILPSYVGIAFRFAIAKNLAKNIGINVYLGPFITIKNWSNLSIGNNVSIHEYCYLDAAGGLEIGNDVSIAHSSSILTSEHQWTDLETPIRWNSVINKSVKIQDDVWVACGVRILSGTIVRNRTIIAAGAIVNKNVEEGTLVAGVPAKFIKQLY